MQTPHQLDFTTEEIEELIARLEEKSLREKDYPLLIELIKGLVWMSLSLQEKTLSIKRLRAIFGIKTETAAKLLDLVNKGKVPKKKTEESKNPKEKKKGNGHRSSSEYTEAKTIKVAHQTLKRGDLCPECKKGKLFNLSPGNVLRIVGTPWLQVEIYKPERLRCSLCSKIFKATLPEEVMTGSRSDKTAKAIVSFLKYRGGLPFYRQEQLQTILGTPIAASEIWKMTEEVANDLLPVYAVLCTKAAQGKLLHNDDTKARVLSILQERKEEEEKRKGTFTSVILSVLDDPSREIALFFTGRQHAGENMNDLLEKREKNLSPPIQQCDGGNNLPKDHETAVSYCLAHSRRKFYELVEDYPEIVIRVIGWFAEIFANEVNSPEEPLERLKWHQEKSVPLMDKIKSYCEGLLENKEVEPNSSMGKAIAYFKNHWEGLTLFLRVPGVPLTNNASERLIKRAVLNRKNAYFYRTEEGAKIGDILMSTMETCVLSKVNIWKYLIAIQEHQKKVKKSPEEWLPWIYEKTLESLHPP
jgi:transposase